MKNELKNILVPAGFNEPSVEAVDFAVHLAGQANGPEMNELAKVLVDPFGGFKG